MTETETTLRPPDGDGDGDDDVGTRSRAAVDALRADLRDRYGDFEVETEEWTQPPAGYERLVERFEAGEGGGAGAWVYDDAGRVLLVEVGDNHGWSDPGGKRRPDESFEAAARRAVREATGVETTVDGVLELRAVTVADGTTDRPALVEPVVVFTLRPTGDPTPEVGEGLADARWFAEPPETPRNRAVRGRPIPFAPDPESRSG